MLSNILCSRRHPVHHAQQIHKATQLDLIIENEFHLLLKPYFRPYKLYQPRLAKKQGSPPSQMIPSFAATDITAHNSTTMCAPAENVKKRKKRNKFSDKETFWCKDVLISPNARLCWPKSKSSMYGTVTRPSSPDVSECGLVYPLRIKVTPKSHYLNLTI